MEASQIQNLFAGNIRRLLVQTEIDYDRLYEIRLPGRKAAVSHL